MAKRVLIVDDTPSGLAFLRDIVTQPHFTVVEAASGRQALEMHRRDPVDLIIMDAQMPGMDGEQVTRTIRGDRTLRNVSILLFTDNARPGLRERYMAAGANDYLAKPFNSAQLMTRVSLLVNVATRKQTALLAHVNIEGESRGIEPFVARIVNLSMSGLLLEADVKLKPGLTVCVKFFVPGATEQVTATATVARRADAAGAVRWGARFSALDLSARRIIRDYVGEK